MAKLFDRVHRYIVFIQVLALLVCVCFTSLLLQSSEKSPQLLRKSSEGNAVTYTVHGIQRKKVQV